MRNEVAGLLWVVGSVACVNLDPPPGLGAVDAGRNEVAGEAGDALPIQPDAAVDDSHVSPIDSPIDSSIDSSINSPIDSPIDQARDQARPRDGLVVGPGPIAHWKLDEGAGTTAADSSKNANNATLSFGPTWSSDVPGTANPSSLRFDGVDDSLNVGSPAVLDNLRTFTIAAWIKPASGGQGGAGRIVDKEQGGWFFKICGPPNCTDGFRLAFFQHYSTSAAYWLSPAGSIVLGVWQHVVFTFKANPAGSNPKVYVNGTEQTFALEALPGEGPPGDDSSLLFSIGNGAGGASGAVSSGLTGLTYDWPVADAIDDFQRQAP